MQVSIRTTQNVFIDQDKAGVGHRILAAIIDFTLLILFSYGISEALTSVSFDSYWVQMLFYFPVFFYHLYMEILNNGQSIGKMVVRLKVVRLDGTPPTIGGYVLRWILSPLDLAPSTGAVAIISIGLTQHGQRLGDLAANTTVIKLQKTKKVSRLQLVEQLEEGYEPRYPEVKGLNDLDINLIKECLEVKAKHDNLIPVNMASSKVKELLSIESDQQPVSFLYTILRDHTYYTTR